MNIIELAKATGQTKWFGTHPDGTNDFLGVEFTPEQLERFAALVLKAEADETRARFAQPERPEALAEPVKQEPVAWKDLTLSEREDIREKYENYPSAIMSATENILREKNAAPVQPMQEPVGYFTYDGDYNIWEEVFSKDVAEAKPLYAAPVDAKAIRAEALEEAAKVCDDESRYSNDAECCAAAIRGLK